MTEPVGERSALRDVRSHVRFWIVVVIGLAIDLWSKAWAFATLGQTGERELIPSLLEFHTTLNPGALFGIGAGRTSLFVVASVLALALVLWMFAQCPARRWFTHIALGAILAGALGNMYDRVFVRLVPVGTAAGGYVYYVVAPSADGATKRLKEFPVTAASRGRAGAPRAVPDLPPAVGYVRDFIKISQKWFGGRDVWPWIFNVADMLLVGGVGILAIRLLRERHPQPVASESALDAGDEKP